MHGTTIHKLYFVLKFNNSVSKVIWFMLCMKFTYVAAGSHALVIHSAVSDVRRDSVAKNFLSMSGNSV